MSVCLIFRMCAVTMPMDPLYAAMAERYPDPRRMRLLHPGCAGYLLFISTAITGPLITAVGFSDAGTSLALAKRTT